MDHAYVQEAAGKRFYFRTDTATSKSCRSDSSFDTEIWFWGGGD